MVLERNGVLIISHDVVGEHMAGPGIRYYHIGRVLSNEFNTVLAVPSDVSPQLSAAGFRTARYARNDWDSIAPLVESAETVILPSDIASDFPQLAQSDTYLVVDGYDPLLIEWLTLERSLNAEPSRESWWRRMCDLNQQYLVGDFFICASERQRDWWLGLLEANGRVNPDTFGADPSLRQLIDVVPYGLPEEPPQPADPVIRGVWPGVGVEDKVILWGGGLWPWLDPLTAIRAVAKIWQQQRDVRLVFPGTRHPNPKMADTPTHCRAAHEVARQLGVLDKGVFFGEWVPYEKWPQVLLESDVALSLHYDTLEARLAFRSRMLDYIWAGLPVVATQGDTISDLAEDYGLGTVVGFEDADAVAEAILRLMEGPPAELAARFPQARKALGWEKAVQPLVGFCREPRRAPDKAAFGDDLGNPFYVDERRHIAAERDRYQELVRRYEGGRFMRVMRWVDRIRQRLGSA